MQGMNQTLRLRGVLRGEKGAPLHEGIEVEVGKSLEVLTIKVTYRNLMHPHKAP